MKKKVLSILLLATMLLTLLPTTALAADYVSTIRVTVTEPAVGEKTTVATVKTTASCQVTNTRWIGDFDDNGCFQAGKSYKIEVTLRMKDGVDKPFIYANASALTINGEEAVNEEFTESQVVLSYTFASLPDTSTPDTSTPDTSTMDKFDLRHAVLRASSTPYTTAEADALWVEKRAYDVIVLDGSAKPKNGYAWNDVFLYDYTKDDWNYITKLIVDFEPALFANDDQKETFAGDMINLPNLKEIWLSDKVDVVQFVESLKEGTEGFPHWYWTNSTSFGTADATLCIPSSSAAAVKNALGTNPPCFTIKVYDGNVYAAQKAGVTAAKDYCTSHTYSAIIKSADRVAHYADCAQPLSWYYSCNVCGKCEHNDNHTISTDFMGDPSIKYDHQYDANLATEEAYVGVNAAGDQVYWKSCVFCGHSYNYHQEHITQEVWKLSGVDLSFAEYQKAMADVVARREADALKLTTSKSDMFTLEAKSDAKMSAWAQSDVNYALDNNLLDTALLGSDYTKPITRLQFCSVAVRLAEELTGKEITAAPSGTFTDTDNLYVRKAYAAGITSGVTATTFGPDSTLTRQQMAVFIYRALQYVEANSNYKYTDYVSKLSAYSDSGQIQSWATESLAFMNALDLIAGTTTTTLSPNGTCTIEQALTVAYRSIYAHQIGWYQTTKEVNYLSVPGSEQTALTLTEGRRVWVTGNRIGLRDTTLDNAAGKYREGDSCWTPVVDPYTGQTQYIRYVSLRPIRD